MTKVTVDAAATMSANEAVHEVNIEKIHLSFESLIEACYSKPYSCTNKSSTLKRGTPVSARSKTDLCCTNKLQSLFALINVTSLACGASFQVPTNVADTDTIRKSIDRGHSQHHLVPTMPEYLLVTSQRVNTLTRESMFAIQGRVFTPGLLIMYLQFVKRLDSRAQLCFL
jgi:hypothetical protein